MHYQASYGCEDCGHTFFYPGQNSPMLVEGGCPECGGNIRPEPDQPSPTHGDGELRDMAGPGYDQDMGGNPLQEGILGQTDGGWQNRQKRDESFASVKTQDNMRFHPESSNQEVKPPWTHFEIEEVAPPGISNEEAEEIIEKKEAALPALAIPGLLAGGEAAAAGGAAGAAGGVGGGIGMGLLRRAVPSLMGSALGTGLGGGSGAQGAPETALTPDQRPFEAIASLDADKDKGSDLSDPRGTSTEGSEDADTKQKDDGDSKPWQKAIEDHADGVGSITGLSPDADDDSPTPGLESLQMMLPLVIHYAESPDSGADHPLVKALSDLLTEEGLLEGPEDHDAAAQIIKLHRHGAVAPQGLAPAAPPVAAGGNPFADGNCTLCGATVTPGQPCPQCGNSALGTQVMANGGARFNDQGRVTYEPPVKECPQCGAPPEFSEGSGYVGACGHRWLARPQVQADQGFNSVRREIDALPTATEDAPRTDGANDPVWNQFWRGAADAGQGPTNPEQIAAVQQLLIDQGRVEEVPNVPVNPAQYAREMAEVANKPDMPPPNVDQGPQPAQEEAPPEATMPMPGMSVPQQGVVANIGFGQCQKCMGPLQQDGSCAGCERSPAAGQAVPQPGYPAAGAPQGNQNAATPVNPAVQQFDPASRPPAYANWTIVGHDNDGAAVGVPAADQGQQYDPSKDQDSSHQWQAADGTPVVQGQQYELHTPGVAVPDVVTVTRILPDAIELEFTGEFQLGFQKQISRQEWETMGYTLVASNGTPDAPPESQGPVGRPEDEGGAGIAQGQGAMGVSDFSPPHGVHSSNVPQLGVPNVDPETGEVLSQERQAAVQRFLELASQDPEGDGGLTHIAGAHFTPSEQRELIDEDGVARNADKLDLSNTHYEARAPLKNNVAADDFLW